MQISVLIAAYCAAPFLPAALASLAAQTHLDWDLVIVEDGSQDGTEDIARRFARDHPGHPVIYENLGENRGVAAARNRLLELARGEAMAFLDADDAWEPGHLVDLAVALAGGCSVAFSGIELWDGDRHLSRGTYLPPDKWLAAPRRFLFEHSFIQTSSCVALSRAAFARAGRIDETLRIGEDRDYWFRCLAGGGQLACTGRVTCRYTKHEGSSMTKTLRVSADTVSFYRKYLQDSSLPYSLRHRLLAQSLWIHARLLRRDDRLKARQLFRAAVRAWPLDPRFWPYLAA